MSTPKQRPPSTCVQNFHSCFSKFSQVANIPTFNYEIDAEADMVIVLRTLNASFASSSPAEVEVSITTFDQGLASEDTDQATSVKVAIAPDDESESILNDIKGDEIWSCVFPRHPISILSTTSVCCSTMERVLRKLSSTRRERGRMLLSARNPGGKLQD
ncbi:uncharacterized protein SETTUDRAFT_40110 [Exserohilum turcica Et28A]|uniref:Uncharacterized protein n=1 Tax=Exserohilum turcicum (strain 28A) TaxID=671987 RepID=R0K8B7_EXST2|nr:uncharacterized protein SETTUDRAFT_40110 [Exserohilum turcica Et28A]EOA85704.1 hypothetical protein SETTUDRAFT_40110 [Exserohilum turcica Et28A]